MGSAPHPRAAVTPRSSVTSDQKRPHTPHLNLCREPHFCEAKSMDVNRITVGLIIAAAACYLFTKIRARYTGRQCGCDQGCSRNKPSSPQNPET
jgi:hypothetical protein